MKKKFFVASVAIVATCGVVLFAQNGSGSYSDAGVLLENVEALANGESGGVCRAIANCYKEEYRHGEWVTVSSGSVSCEGTEECESGDGWVKCDGDMSICRGY